MKLKKLTLSLMLAGPVIGFAAGVVAESDNMAISVGVSATTQVKLPASYTYAFDPFSLGGPGTYSASPDMKWCLADTTGGDLDLIIESTNRDATNPDKTISVLNNAFGPGEMSYQLLDGNSNPLVFADDTATDRNDLPANHPNVSASGCNSTNNTFPVTVSFTTTASTTAGSYDDKITVTLIPDGASMPSNAATA